MHIEDLLDEKLKWPVELFLRFQMREREHEIQVEEIIV